MFYFTIMTLTKITNLQGVLSYLPKMIANLPNDLINLIPGLINLIPGLINLIPGLIDWTGGLISKIPGIWPPNFNISERSDSISELLEFIWHHFPSFPVFLKFEFPGSLITVYLTCRTCPNYSATWESCLCGE